MTKTDTYNAHICSDFTPHLGSDNLYQTAFHVGNEVEWFHDNWWTVIVFTCYFNL